MTVKELIVMLQSVPLSEQEKDVMLFATDQDKFFTINILDACFYAETVFLDIEQITGPL